jgi:hypothetical protein
MSTKATSTFTIDSWDEHPYREAASGGKLTRAHVKQTFSGDIEGQGEVQWLMCYRPDSTADFVGLQHFAGRVGERSGTIVLETRGTFDGQAATAPCASSPTPAPTSSEPSSETVNKRSSDHELAALPVAQAKQKRWNPCSWASLCRSTTGRQRPSQSRRSGQAGRRPRCRIRQRRSAAFASRRTTGRLVSRGSARAVDCTWTRREHCRTRLPPRPADFSFSGNLGAWRRPPALPLLLPRLQLDGRELLLWGRRNNRHAFYRPGDSRGALSGAQVRAAPARVLCSPRKGANTNVEGGWM